MSNSFYSIFKFIQKHRLGVMIGGMLFLLLSIFIIKKISFNEDINKVIPKDHSNTTTTDIISQMSFADKIAVIIAKKEGGSDEELTHAAQIFLNEIDSFPQYYHNIQGTLDEELFQKSFEFVYRHLPIYLDAEDYKIIQSKLNKDSIGAEIESNYEMLTSGSASFMKDIVIKDPLKLSFLALKKLQKFQGADEFVFENGFLYSKDHTKLFLFINPKYSGSETKNNEVFADHLKSIQGQINGSNAKVEISYFGAPLIAVANAKQIKQDILKTVAISVSVLMLLLIFYYRNWLVPIIVMIPSVFGGLFGLLCLYFIRSEISAISLSISAILIGITVDYALHFLTHSKSSQQMKQLFKDVSKPLLMSSSTTAVAFLCLLFVRSEALIDLGIFASIAVVSTAVFTLIILPHVYQGKPIQHNHLIDRIATYPFEKNKVLIAFSLLLVIVSLFTYHKVTFDGDLSKLNFVPADQKSGERALSQGDKLVKKLFLVNYDGNESDLLERNQKLLNELAKYPQVSHTQSLSYLLPDFRSQELAIQTWNTFWNKERIAKTVDEIETESTEMGFIKNTHAPFYSILNHSFSTINLDSVKAFDRQLYSEFVHGSDKQKIISSIVSLNPEDRDAFVKEFEKNNSKDQVLIIDRQALNEQYLGYLIKDFNSLIGYSFVAVYLILFVFYKRIELVLVASIPIALTGFITAGLMGLLNIPFNIFSTIVCTLVFGHGIDFTIFMTSALQKEYTYGRNEMPVYRTSIILAVLTTILAIGALVFAKHPALKSISAIALIGVSIAVVVTFVLYPPLFKFFFSNRVKKGLSPITLLLLFQSVFLFAYFAIMSVLVSLLMRCIFWIFPISKQKKHDLFSKWMSWYMTTVLYLKPQTTKHIFDKEKLRYTGQSVIIANHTSFLDSLSMAMLNPYVVFLVNDWVYNSPIFGRAVKLLGFLPTSVGLENQLDILRKRIGNYYSIVVFPEGRRSQTSEIHRFHKGAFYLAEQLDLPILPIYLHGNADALPKGDFIIYDGVSDIYVGEVISPGDNITGFKEPYNAKKISKDFRDTFKQIRQKAEGVGYFKKKLYLNYLYRENDIATLVKKDFGKHKDDYYALFYLLEEKAHIAHITEDIGQTDFLMLSQFPSRQITTFNRLTEHREISRSSYIVHKFKVKYVDEIRDVWIKNELLLISHLGSLDIHIPGHISQIVMLCCTFESEFSGFRLSYDEGNVKVYQRYESKEEI